MNTWIGLGMRLIIRIMRIFFIFLVLIFSHQPWVKANDMSDFEIEGMSIGDSLLDYMNENIITKEMNNKDISFYYQDDFVAISTWDIRNKFKLYDDVGVILKPNDKQYKIYGLEGTLYMKKGSDIEECYKKQNKIVNAIKNSLNINDKGDDWFIPKEQLLKHQISIKAIDFELTEGGAIRTLCYEIKPGVKKHSDLNLLYVVVNSPTFWNYLNSSY